MNRTQALCRAFGWQGGTIHQIAERTGCSVYDLIYGNVSDTGCDTIYLCGLQSGYMYHQNNYIPFAAAYQGELDFWLGVANGIIQHENSTYGADILNCTK